MNILIVDDEPLARARLRQLVEKIPGAVVSGEARDVPSAIAALREATHDVILLDIQMPGESGMEFAQHPLLPPVVFVTAHDQHALRAFDVSAVDYLLKPVTLERLQRALGRVTARASSSTHATRLAVRSGETVEFIALERVTRLWASDKYVVCTVDGQERLLSDSLNELEVRLCAHRFLRTHRAELVNLEAVCKLHCNGHVGELEMTDGQRARVSRRMMPAVRRALGL